MSKEYYKKKIIDLRADIAREKEQKKRDNERYAALIKGASSPSSKGINQGNADGKNFSVLQCCLTILSRIF